MLHINQKVIEMLQLPKYMRELPPNHKHDIPKDLIFFDTETTQIPIEFKLGNSIRKGFKHEFKLGCADWFHNGKLKQRIVETDPIRFVNFIFNGHKGSSNIYIFCHNLKFDFTIIEPYIPDLIKINIKSFNFDFGKAFVRIARIGNGKNRKGSYLFIDSHNYFHGSLEELGKLFGLQKLKIDFTKCSIEELSIYCQKDVEILRVAVMYILENFVINKIKTPTTCSNLSFSTYRNFHMNPYKIMLYPKEQLSDFERKSYHGGRVEIFDMNKFSNVASLDVNGMYSYVMQTRNYPIEPIETVSSIENIPKDKCIIADCSLKIDEYIPPFPFNIKNKLIFPNGKFRSILTTPEIEIAINNNYLEKINECVIYDSAPIFENFISTYSKLKEEAKLAQNLLMHTFYKLLGNGLYGKFGQQINDWEEVKKPYMMHEGDIYVEAEEKLYKVRKIFNRYWIRSKKRNGFYSNVAIASHITAYARCYLWNILRLSKPIYCDTDSVFIPDECLSDYEKMIGTKLGMLSIKGLHETFQAYQPKTYDYGKIHRRKGIPHAAIVKDGAYIFTHFMGFHESLNKFGNPQVTEFQQSKMLSNIYEKRMVNIDGTTEAITIAA